MVGTRQFDEDTVLGAALDLFWRRGFAATSMIDLAQTTGVQRGSLYNAYGDKEQLFLLAFDQYAQRFLSSAQQALSDPDPRAALAAFFETAIANMTSGSPSRGCLTTKTAIEGSHTGAAIEARVKRLVSDLTSLVVAVFSTAAARRILVIEPAAAAELAVTFTRGLAVMERVHGSRKRLRSTAANFVRILFAHEKDR